MRGKKKKKLGSRVYALSRNNVIILIVVHSRRRISKSAAQHLRLDNDWLKVVSQMQTSGGVACRGPSKG